MNCLCKETDYQNSAFQCLYSQCDATDFGVAVQHAIVQCSGLGGDVMQAIRPIVKHSELRRRKEAEYLSGTYAVDQSAAMDAYPVKSGNPYPTQTIDSDLDSLFPTQSAGFPLQSVESIFGIPTSTIPIFPLQSDGNPAASHYSFAPTIAAAPDTTLQATPAAQSALGEPSPVQYTGGATIQMSTNTTVIWIAVSVSALYLALS
ncbi:hypothetical protein BJ878DRAFT_543134 [Calycina marina]|uniref:Extracellular membrane protein CFEM domain-containing protein n=1 Tax=Calycina marina TaxID=1763456 RepID=A0A9P8CEA3_9HELO|nr:hypothetical protein BJ878DRAFT_543134 [Calycina marina]